MTRIDPFGQLPDGRPVQRVRLAAGELSAAVLTWGAVLQDVRLAGVPWPLTLGGPDLAAYAGGPMQYCGSVVGPVANRISGATASIDGRQCRFEANIDGRATLHGGSTGTHAQLWQIADAAPDALTLALTLPDGLGGFPGTRRLRATFRLEPPATLTLTLATETDAPTPVNLANHSYWSLDGSADHTGHRLTVAADRYLPTDALKLPRDPTPVAGTPFDFRAGRVLTPPEGLDHNLCLAEARRPLTEAAELTGRSGVRLRLATTEPGLQVYDAEGYSSAPFPGHAGHPYGSHAGLALEAQGWPNALNRPDFPPILLRPGKTLEQTTRFRFDRV